MALKTSEQSLRSPLNGKERDSTLEEIFPGRQHVALYLMGSGELNIPCFIPWMHRLNRKGSKRERVPKKIPGQRKCGSHRGRITTLNLSLGLPRWRSA